MAANTGGSKQVWLVERYARYNMTTSRDISMSQSTQDQVTGDGNNWQHYSSLNGQQIHMALINANHFLITQGEIILESFSLWGTHNWIKAIAKGDSILFVSRQQVNSRKFRIKMSPNNGKSSLDICRDVINNLKNLLPIKLMDDPLEPSPPTEESDGHSHSTVGITLKERAQDILSKPLNQAYTTHLPTDNLSQFVRLCLTDSTFPAFVEAVENELNALK